MTTHQNTTTQTITRDELADLLRQVNHATFAGITAETDARLKKTGNPFALPVMKRQSHNLCLCFEYERSVNRQRGREGTEQAFEAQARKWGQRIEGTPLVEHKGKLYVTGKVEHTASDVIYRDALGHPLDPEAIAPFKPASRSSAAHQGVDREVITRDWSLDSITRITLNHVTYLVTD